MQQFCLSVICPLLSSYMCVLLSCWLGGFTVDLILQQSCWSLLMSLLTKQIRCRYRCPGTYMFHLV